MDIRGGRNRVRRRWTRVQLYKRAAHRTGGALAVLAEPTNESMRYRMLETLREYAAEQLSTPGKVGALQEPHAPYYASLAEELENAVYGPQQLAALRNFEVEHNNFRAVLSAGSRGGVFAAYSAGGAASLAPFWFLRNYLTEARLWCDRVLSLDGVAKHRSATRCLCLDGFFATSMGEHAVGLNMCDRAIAEAEAEHQGDTSLIAWTYFFRCGAAFVTGDAVATERDAPDG